MNSTNSLRAPDLLDARNTVEMLELTGIQLASGDHDYFTELENLAARLGPSAAATAFLSPRLPMATQRWAAFIASHLYDGDAPRSLQRPAWTLPSGVRGRALTRLEQAICRVTVDRWPTCGGVTPAHYALAEVSATSGELAALPIEAVTPRTRATVRLGGGRDQTARLAELDPWGTRVIIQRLNTVDASDRTMPLVYDGSAPASAKAQASSSGNLARVLRFAGFGQDRTLNPTSIRNSAAARSYENGADIEQVAELMGCRSLDKVRRILTSLPC